MQSIKQRLANHPRLYNILRTAKGWLTLGATRRGKPGASKNPVSSLTVVDVGRLLFFKRMLDSVSDVDGDVVECGVGWGRSLMYLALLCWEEQKGRHIWGFDSFEGFPEPTAEDSGPRHPQKGEYKADMKAVYALLEQSKFDAAYLRSKITLVKGFFAESLPKYAGPGIVLLHIDADLYQSYLDVLKLLYDKVRPGGVIAFDEYMDGRTNVDFPGAKAAIDEFFRDKRVEIRRDKRYGKYFAVKPRQ